jgi:RNA polymerase sigma factor (sigma-70 family)
MFLVNALNTARLDERCQDRDRSDIAQEIVVAVQKLPPIYRQVLVMRDLEEMTAIEVAEVLGITVEAVKSLHRARNTLRATLSLLE